MCAVSVFHGKDGMLTQLRIMNEQLLSRCSCTARDLLQDQKGAEKAVTIFGVGSAPLNYVLEEIQRHGTDVYIKTHREPLDRAVAIFQAVEALAVDPAQPQVEGSIVQFIAHNKLEPRWMVAVHLAFESRIDSSKAWTTMVHQLAWDLNNGNYEAEEAAAPQKAASAHPSLHQAIDEKIENLENRRSNYDEASTKFAARKERIAEKQSRTRVRDIHQRVHDHNNQLRYEETHGMREASEATVEWALTSKPGSYYIGRPKKELKKQKRQAGKKVDEGESGM
ncbi:uncharacterized protein LTR77_001978 [Saxophila tyrrhenica]|uniref:Uncharacterized protein n=1 Tax=Saxophila tyrrhenica TaxID=1690608 RepID=A0AAV9PHP0_9PEZI|nr:hypothetical protein LTR77_001978 [Saxophila tyrrhenica]